MDDDSTRRMNPRIGDDTPTEMIPELDPPHSDEYPSDEDTSTRAFSRYQQTQTPELDPDRWQGTDSTPPRSDIPPPPQRPVVQQEEEVDPVALEEKIAKFRSSNRTALKVAGTLSVAILIGASLIAWATTREPSQPKAANTSVTQQAPPPSAEPAPVAPDSGDSDGGVLKGLRDKIDGLQKENAQLRDSSAAPPPPAADQQQDLVQVPDILDLSAKQADKALRSAGFTDTKFVDQDGSRVFLMMTKDTTMVISVDPPIGVQVDPGKAVEVMVQDQQQ